MGYGNQEVEKGDEKKGRPSKQLRKRRRRTQKRATLRVVTLLHYSVGCRCFVPKKINEMRFILLSSPLQRRQLLFLPSSNLDTFDDSKSGSAGDDYGGQFHFSANRNVDDFPIGAHRKVEKK